MKTKVNQNNEYYFTYSRIFFLIILLQSQITKCDLPVHCKREAIDGIWTFRIDKEIIQPSLKNAKTTCGHGFPDKIENVVGDQDYSFNQYWDIKIKLGSDYKVYEESKVVGTWTPVYDEGFILKYKESVFTAFMKYYKEYSASTDYISNCSKTMIGWYIPNDKLNNKNWSCFFGFKDYVKKNFLKNGQQLIDDNFLDNETHLLNILKSTIPEYPDFLSIKEKLVLKNKTTSLLNEKLSVEEYKKIKYEDQVDIVNEINSMNLSWKAQVHNEFKGLNLLELSHVLGLSNKNSRKAIQQTSNDFFSNSRKSKTHKNQKKKSNLKAFKDINNTFFLKESDETNFIQLLNREKIDNEEIKEKDSNEPISIEQIQKYLNTEINDIDEDTLAKNWDWRNVGGKNFIPRLRRQGSCGSCYIFSTVSSLESRLRIMTNNKDTTEFSRQFPLSCSFYTEGCEGGYPILVGKFFNEFEIIPEECFEYAAKNVPCSHVCDFSSYPKKYTVSRYEYLGGFYGATSEVDMMKEIRARGPIPGNISVPWSFSYYSTGIYSHDRILKKNSGRISKSTLFDKKLSFEKVDHSITLVGWGEENGVKYWIAMNTWGEHWGENGFFRIVRGENECSVESMGDCFRINVENRK